MNSLLKTISLGLLFSVLTGCYAMYDCIEEYKISYRNQCEARMAWHQVKHDYAECEEYLHSFGQGFQAGYIDIANGGDGCPPMLPPRHYWNCHYQSECGREETAAWFDGFGHGVAVALAGGVGHRNSILTAQELYGPGCNKVPDVVEFPTPPGLIDDDPVEEFDLGNPPLVPPPDAAPIKVDESASRGPAALKIFDKMKF